MTPETAFKEFETTVNADPDQLTEARLRRDGFVKAFERQEDVERACAVGSLARKTQKAPLNDVDIVVVYKADEYPDWGSSTCSATAAEAIAQTAETVKSLLGADGSEVELLNPDGGTGSNVRLAVRKRHSVKCFLDKAGEPDAFTVDAVPAIAHPDGGLLIPERDLDDDAQSTWIRSDPGYLIGVTADLQKAWKLWVPCVRLLKYWNSETKAGMSSLYVEVLAHTALPINDTRPRALARFFQAAESLVSANLSDPAGLCGPLQSSLDVAHARSCLSEAAELAWKAVTAEADEREDDAVCAWAALFGSDFPTPPDGCTGEVATATAAAAASWARPKKQEPTPRRVRNSPQG